MAKKSKDIAEMAFMMATDVFGKSKYRKDDTAVNYGWEYNVGLWENGYWHSDCLGFVHICVNGFFGDRNVLGGGAVMNDFVLASDEWTTLNKYCSNRGNFPVESLRPASLLQNSGHVGLYIGDHEVDGKIYNTAECTLALEKGWLLTWVDIRNGNRHSSKDGARLATGWEHWGEFDMIDYSEPKPEPEPEPKPKKTYSDVTPDMSSYRAIMWATEQGLYQGYKDGTFRPNEPLTRAQDCVVRWREAGRP